MKRLVKVGAGLTALFAVQLSNPTTDTFAQKKSNEVAAIIEENLEKETNQQSTEPIIEPTINEEAIVEKENDTTTHASGASETPVHSEEIIVIPENILGTPPILPDEEVEEVVLPDEETEETVVPEVVESGGVNVELDEEVEEVILPEARENGVNVEEEGEEVILPEDDTQDEEVEVEGTDEEKPYEVDTPSLTEEEEGGYEVLPEDPEGEDGSQIGGETPILPEGPNGEVAVDSIWSMDGRVISAYNNGKVEYEFAFRHNPIIGVAPIDLEDAVFYLDLPEGAIFKSATFGGKYDAENHRVYWNNPGGISTSHANFHPLTPRRVNVQLFFEQPEGEKVATAYATYVPKGGEELTTNTVTIQHGFESEAPVLEEGITIKGELAERPGIPASFPVLTGERFTYDVSYSMKTDTPYRDAELIVQLSDQLKFDKHVQLTGDFKTYRYDEENHRFVFVFKPEILEAHGVMKINNLYFPNFYTEPGTEGMIQMFLQYNENETVAINPDILNAYAEADWDVTTDIVSDVDPTVGERVTYIVEAKDTNVREEGSLVLKDLSVVHELAKEAVFKQAYTLIDGQRIEGVYNKDTHTVTFKLDELSNKQQLFYIDVEYQEALENVECKTTLTYQGLGQDEMTKKTTEVTHPVESKEDSSAAGKDAPEEKPSTGGGSSTEGEDHSSEDGKDAPEEKPSTGGGSSTEGEDHSSEDGKDAPEEKPSTGGGGGGGWIAPEDIVNQDNEKEEDLDDEETPAPAPEESPQYPGDKNDNEEPSLPEEPSDYPLDYSGEGEREDNSSTNSTSEKNDDTLGQVVEKDSTPAVTEGMPTTNTSSSSQQAEMNQVVQKESKLPQTNEQVSMWAWLSGLLAMLGGLVVYFRPSKKRSDDQ